MQNLALDLSQKAIEMGRKLSRLKSWIEAAEKLRCIPNSAIFTQNIVKINAYMKEFAF